MPPKKEKKEKVEQFSGDQASELMIQYLRRQNRPYSATDISANLHNAVTKTTAAKLLKDLHEKGLIEGRVSGKQVVYHTVQDPNDFASPEELKDMDLEIEAAKQEATALKSELRGHQSNLNKLKATPTTASLSESLSLVEAEIQALETELVPLRMSGTPHVTSDEKAIVDAEFLKVERLLKTRKKQFNEFWGMICEHYSGNRSELWERLGLEGDEV